MSASDLFRLSYQDKTFPPKIAKFVKKERGGVNFKNTYCTIWDTWSNVASMCDRIFTIEITVQVITSVFL